MLAIPRVLARDFRAVLRRALADAAPRGPLPPVLCRAGPGGRTLYSGLGDRLIGHHTDGEFPIGELAFPASALAAFEGAGVTPVALEEAEPGRGRARWDDAGAARSAEFPTVPSSSVAPFPAVPASLTAVPVAFLAALGEAALSTADQDSHRLSLARVQLRGRTGEVVGSDGRQLFVHAGFPLPWEEDLVVPRVPAFAGRLLAGAGPAAVGRSESEVFVRAGPWTFALTIDAAARYPDVRGVIPRPSDRSARLRVHPDDAALLLQALPRLAGKDDDLRPVTLDLGPRPAIRAKAASGGAVEEIVLARSSASGPPLCVVTDRRYLLRALRLGFREVEAGPGERPLVCRDAKRTYLWMHMSGSPALSPPSDSRRAAPPAPAPSAAVTLPNPTTRKSDMPPPVPPNGPAPRNGAAAASNGAAAPEAGLEELLAEADALRNLLHEAGGRLARLVAGLKHQRRQAKAVETALASLRTLQRAGGGAP